MVGNEWVNPFVNCWLNLCRRTAVTLVSHLSSVRDVSRDSRTITLSAFRCLGLAWLAFPCLPSRMFTTWTEPNANEKLNLKKKNWNNSLKVYFHFHNKCYEKQKIIAKRETKEILESGVRVKNWKHLRIDSIILVRNAIHHNSQCGDQQLTPKLIGGHWTPITRSKPPTITHIESRWPASQPSFVCH